MDTRIDRWRSDLPPEIAARLDGTPDSLPAVQELLLDRFTLPDEAEEAAHAEFVDGATRYIGTVFQQAAGGEWSYAPGETNRSRITGRPYLVRQNSDGEDQLAIPHRIIRSTVKQRTPGMIALMLKNYAA